MEQSWIGKPRFQLDGVIYRYDVGNADQEAWTRAKQVPADRVVAHIEGVWMKQIKYKLKGEKVSSSVCPDCPIRGWRQGPSRRSCV